MLDREDALAPGTVLEGYRFDAILGAGGFGITYLATEVLIDRLVAIKEFMPSGIAHREPNRATVRPLSAGFAKDFAWGLGRFRDEAKTLVALRHPNIVCVNHYFEANATGYLVMEYERGKSLGQLLQPDLTLEESEIEEFVFPLLKGLAYVHSRGFLHRDIKPDNIFIRDDGTTVLLDFGTARQALVERSKSLTAIVTPGYAPMEQYESGDKQGPWTDLYAVGAALYRCVTGERPPDAPARVAARFRGDPDPIMPVATAARGTYSASLLAAIEWALALDARTRPQDCNAFAARLKGRTPLPDQASETLAAGAVPPPKPRQVTVVATARETLETPAPRRRRRGLWMAAAAMAALIGVSYAAYTVWPDSNDNSRTESRTRLAEKIRQVHVAIQKGALDDAKRSLDEASQIDSASADVAAARAALASAVDRRRRANERIARARNAIARNNPIAAEQEVTEAERIDSTAADFAALRNEISALRQRIEGDARRKAEEDAAKRRVEDEARRKAEEEARRRRAEDEAKRKAQEDEARRRAEDEARRKAEEEKQKAEEERRKAEERDRGREQIGPGMRNNLNLPGEDYANFDLSSSDPALCQQRCQGDVRCVAWTYVRAGAQGQQARCWLKNRIPAQVASPCCVSGVIQRDGAPATQRIEWPRVGNYYVDNCLYWGRECGKAAAEAYCRQAGFRGAQSWGLQHRVPTLVLGDRKVCNEAVCVAFNFVVCLR